MDGVCPLRVFLEISEDYEKPEFDLMNVNIANKDELVRPT